MTLPYQLFSSFIHYSLLISRLSTHRRGLNLPSHLFYLLLELFYLFSQPINRCIFPSQLLSQLLHQCILVSNLCIELAYPILQCSLNDLSLIFLGLLIIKTLRRLFQLLLQFIILLPPF